MIEGHTVLALIPARGGSKGVPRKNIRSLAGRSLIEWTLRAAQASTLIDRIILSSEDAEIITHAKHLGCEVPFIRPAELARDDTNVIEVVRHAIQALETRYDYLVLLQPTSPLRRPDDIDNCLHLCHQHQAPACVSICQTDESPAWMFERRDDMTLRPVLSCNHDAIPYRRQEVRRAYRLNGAVYVARCDWLMHQSSFLSPQTITYLMPQERSIDIDTELDFLLAETLTNAA